MLELRWEKGKAEATEECKAVHVGVKAAVILVLSRETVEGKRHPRRREGGSVGVSDGVIGNGGGGGRAVVKLCEVTLEATEIEREGGEGG